MEGFGHAYFLLKSYKRDLENLDTRIYDEKSWQRNQLKDALQKQKGRIFDLLFIELKAIIKYAVPIYLAYLVGK